MILGDLGRNRVKKTATRLAEMTRSTAVAIRHEDRGLLLFLLLIS